jgi:hypothetical protein
MKILLFLCITFSVSAQIKGVVKDSITGQPIPYVGIWTNSLGNSTSSGAKGKFRLEKNPKTEFIELFTTTYERKKVFIADLKKEVFLIPKKKRENNSSDLTNEYQKRVSDFDVNSGKRIKFVSFNNTCLLAEFIPFDKVFGSTAPFLKSIKIDLMSTDKAIYKIRFFKADSLGNPSEEIGQEEIIGSMEKTTLTTIDSKGVKIKKDLQALDLSGNKIPFPETGLFVAVEIMKIEENESFLKDRNSNKIEMLNPSLKIDNEHNPNVWRFENSKWTHQTDLGEFGINLILTN